jgi:Flp pilus assembly pilin Flp
MKIHHYEEDTLNFTLFERGKDTQMNRLKQLYVRTRESERGQTMAEYALVLLAVAVLAFAGYQRFGTSVGSDVNSINNAM